jgi:hypothetical protein
MSSVTSPQQTGRRGSDEIPGPRAGQGVRLLVLGADPDAQTLRDKATAAGYELAQRYSARVSHVAYGSGVDPGDARYTKIRDAGLVLLPLQKCAEELGLGRADAMDTEAATETGAGAGAETEAAAQVEAVTGGGAMAEAEAGLAAGISDEITAETTAEITAETAAEITARTAAEITAEPEYDADDAPLEIPPLHPRAEAIEATEAAEVAEVIAEEPVEVEVEADLADDLPATAFVPGFADEAPGVPLAAAVIGLDPWIGGADEVEVEVEDEVEDEAEIAHSEAPIPVPTHPTHPAGHVLFSILWALIPFATFGLLSPITFGYAAYRLRSRALVLTAVGYTIAVVASFVLSAVRPHSATPSDTAGALLTLCLAGTWIGGTLHAVGIRTRVFAR